jgi:anti-anti-sigma factor
VSGQQAIAVVRLDGELDLTRREEIRSALTVTGNEAGILVDLATVTYADSTVLAELLRFQKDATHLNVPVAVIVVTEQFARVVKYAGLDEALPIFDSRASALTYLGTRS